MQVEHSVFKKTNTYIVNLMGVAVPLGILYAAYLLHLNSAQKSIWLLLLGVAFAASMFAAFFNYWRLLKITEAPISTIASAAQGYIELHGVASAQNLLKTPYHGISCVWYRAWAYANRAESSLSRKPIDNRLLEYLESDNPFQLKDETGICMVDPNGAEIIFAEQRTLLKNEHRYVEEYLPAGRSVYVLGRLDTRHDHFDKAAMNQEVRETLADLKQRPQKLLNRYDHNRNGQIDMDEWEAARQDAIRHVHAKHVMKAHTGSFTLTKPLDGHLFLISAKSPQELAASYRRWAIMHFAILVMLIVAMVRFT